MACTQGVRDYGPRIALALLAFVVALTVTFTPAVEAQTFTVIHNFSGSLDGATPT